jgi:hypothetical protein
MANKIGEALEHVSRCTGTVAHLYRNLNIGASANQVRLDSSNFHEDFRPMISNLGTILRVPRPRINSQNPTQPPIQ